MKTAFFASIIIAASALRAGAADINLVNQDECVATIRNIRANRADDIFLLRFTIDLSRLNSVKSEQRETVTPVLHKGENRATLPGAIVSGRSRRIRDLREGYSPEGYTMFRAGDADSLQVEAILPFADWMLDADLSLTDTVAGCNCRPERESGCLVATFDMRPRIFAPEFVYITPVAETEKTRQADGHAYIDFPVNKTEIYPDYRRNPVELARIRDTIEIIKNDPDYSITALTLKGYASPEGSYANNERLAKFRTEALRQYIRNLYDFPASILKTDWEAEDWNGLTAYLRSCNLPNRDAMLRIATDPVYDGNPDGREWKLKSTYPEQYKILLADVYPGLRHTDYTVSYTVRSYASIDEIRRAWAEDPRKLSLNELYRLAQSMKQGSPEYIDVFETAARLYPHSPEANINAAIPALQAGDLARAARYLDRAGDSPEAIYARAILAAKKGDFQEALPMMQRAADAGITQAADATAQLREIIARSRP